MFQDLSSIPAFFVSSFEALGEPSLVLARVVRGDPPPYRVRSGDGEWLVAVLGRVQRSDFGSVVAGDWVAIDRDLGVVRHVLPRRTVFQRRAPGKGVRPQIVAANVDVVFLVMGLDSDFNVRRLSRYLALAHASGARPVVLLTKAASAVDLDARLLAAKAAAGAVPVHAIDVVAGVEPDAASRYLEPGVTAALLGSSGVGKSTLLNHWLGRAQVETGEVRAKDGKGRHTTTHRELFALPSGAAIVDTPGMRELALWCDEESINAVFEDVAKVASECRFRDCRHEGEPGCAVKRALEAGTIDAERAHEFEKLQRELAQDRNQRRAWEKGQGRRGAKLVREVMRIKYGRHDE